MSLPPVTYRFVVYLAHQRTGRVDHPQATNPGIVLDFPGDPMGAEHGNGACRDVANVFDEAGALLAQTLDNVLVVDDFVPNVDGRAVDLQRPFDNVDGPDHAGAEPPWLCEQDPQRLLRQMNSPGTAAMRNSEPPLMYRGRDAVVNFWNLCT